MNSFSALHDFFPKSPSIPPEYISSTLSAICISIFRSLPNFSIPIKSYPQSLLSSSFASFSLVATKLDEPADCCNFSFCCASFNNSDSIFFPRYLVDACKFGGVFIFIKALRALQEFSPKAPSKFPLYKPKALSADCSSTLSFFPSWPVSTNEYPQSSF